MTVHTRLACAAIRPGDEISDEITPPRGLADCPECGVQYKTDCNACNRNNNHVYEFAGDERCHCCGARRELS